MGRMRFLSLVPAKSAWLSLGLKNGGEMMRFLLISIVLFLTGCSEVHKVTFDNTCSCLTEMFIENVGFVPVSARSTNAQYRFEYFNNFQTSSKGIEEFVIVIRQNGFVYEYVADQPNFYEFDRKYKLGHFPKSGYHLKADEHGQVFIMDKDGDWNALTAIGYVLKTSKAS